MVFGPANTQKQKLFRPGFQMPLGAAGVNDSRPSWELRGRAGGVPQWCWRTGLTGESEGPGVQCSPALSCESDEGALAATWDQVPECFTSEDITTTV